MNDYTETTGQVLQCQGPEEENETKPVPWWIESGNRNKELLSLFDIPPSDDYDEICKPKVSKNLITVLRGHPGSGKSTFAKILSNKRGGTLILEEDSFHCSLGRYHFDIGSTEKANEVLIQTAALWAKSGCDVIVVSTFRTVDDILHLRYIAKNLRCCFQVIRMTGNFKNVHDVSRKMVNRYKYGLVDYLEGKETIMRPNDIPLEDLRSVGVLI